MCWLLLRPVPGLTPLSSYFKSELSNNQVGEPGHEGGRAPASRQQAAAPALAAALPAAGAAARVDFKAYSERNCFFLKLHGALGSGGGGRGSGPLPRSLRCRQAGPCFSASLKTARHTSGQQCHGSHCQRSHRPAHSDGLHQRRRGEWGQSGAHACTGQRKCSSRRGMHRRWLARSCADRPCFPLPQTRRRITVSVVLPAQLTDAAEVPAAQALTKAATTVASGLVSSNRGKKELVRMLVRHSVVKGLMAARHWGVHSASPSISQRAAIMAPCGRRAGRGGRLDSRVATVRSR